MTTTDQERSTADADVNAATADPYRWIICTVLFFGLTINYIDRQILSLLKPILDDQLHWTNAQFGQINAAFQFAYAVSLLGFGWFIDRFGPKLGYAISITAWSAAAAGHALVGSIPGFFVARVALGLGEGGSFPASIRTVAGWFSQRERALATSLFNAGSNVGALLAPAIVPLIAYRFGWHWCFIAAGAAGFVWLAFWLALYRAPPLESVAAIAEVTSRSGGAESELPTLSAGNSSVIDYASPADADRLPADATLASVLRHRQAWAFVAGKMLTDPVWWFFLTWLPDYFKKTRGMDLKASWAHLSTIYAIVTVLSIIGGWVPKWLVHRGISPNAARKGTMLVSALCAVPIMATTSVGPWGAVMLIGLAGAAHQSWSANLFSITSDMFPQRVVGGLVGFGGMAGSVSSIMFPILTGMLLDRYTAAGNATGGYSILFIVCGSAYVLAYAVAHVLAPRFDRVVLASE